MNASRYDSEHTTMRKHTGRHALVVALLPDAAGHMLRIAEAS